MDRPNELYFGGLQPDITIESFQAWLTGIITDITLVQRISVLNSRGCAFVTFNRPETAELVLQHDGFVWNGLPVRIRRAAQRSPVALTSSATPDPANSNKAIASAFDL